MNIDWLYSFLETSRQRSFSKASDLLNLTQPALSKQMRQLESELRVELFRRSAFGVELTAEGLLLQDRIIPLLNDYESLKQDLVNLNQLHTVRLASLPSLATHYLPQRVTGMSREGMKVKLNVLNTSAEIVDLLQSGSVDIAVVQSGPRIPKTFWSAELFSESFYVVLPQTHPLSSKDSVTLDELVEEAFIVYPMQCDIRNSIVEAFHTLHIEPNLAVEVAFGESIPGFIASGAGISILPEIIAKHVRPASLTAVPVTGGILSRSISLISAKPDMGKKLRRYFT